MFILTEPTPNPNAMKFTPGIQLTVGRACGFARADFDPRQSPLAGRLLAIADVAGVYIDPAFVTVTRSSGGRPWGELRRDAIAAISDHLESGDLAVARASHRTKRRPLAQSPKRTTSRPKSATSWIIG